MISVNFQMQHGLASTTFNSAFRSTRIFHLHKLGGILEHASLLPCNVDMLQGNNEQPDTPSAPSIRTPSSANFSTTKYIQIIQIYPEAHEILQWFLFLRPLSDVLPVNR